MLENVQVIQDNGQNKFAVIDFQEFILIKDLLSDAKKLGIVNYVELLIFICLKYKAKKSKTYRKLTMPKIERLFGLFTYSNDKKTR